MQTIGILLFDDVDVIDAGGPYEVFLTASRLAVRAGDPAPFEVVTIGVTAEPVEAYGGLRLIPQRAAGEVERLDVLIVPGTTEVDAVLARASLLEAVRRLAERSTITASICTGAFLLAELGLLANCAYTTHWEDVDALAERLGTAGARRGVRWVDEGDIVTAAGLSSGIAAALHLVDRLVGRSSADATARQLDYDWDPSGER